jgi:hypothetical protein
MDVVGMNCFWSSSGNGAFFTQLRASTSLPLLVTEFGIDSFDNRAGDSDEIVQATWLADLWRNIVRPAASCLGADRPVNLGRTVFEWMDEPWKAGSTSSCTPARSGLHVGWAPTALPDNCANEAFWGKLSSFVAPFPN